MKPGDLVQLKSGGAVMVVCEPERMDPQGVIRCVWHDKNHQPHSVAYGESQLRLFTGERTP